MTTSEYFSKWEDHISKWGEEPPKIAGKYIRISFSDERAFRKEFIKQSIRFPSCMYRWEENRQKPNSRGELKMHVASEFEYHQALRAFVHGRSKFIPAIQTRKNINQSDNFYQVIKGYQYYTLQFNFLGGHYSETCDVLLFTKVEQHNDEHDIDTFWRLFPDGIILDIIAP